MTRNDLACNCLVQSLVSLEARLQLLNLDIAPLVADGDLVDLIFKSLDGSKAGFVQVFMMLDLGVLVPEQVVLVLDL